MNGCNPQARKEPQGKDILKMGSSQVDGKITFYYLVLVHSRTEQPLLLCLLETQVPGQGPPEQMRFFCCCLLLPALAQSLVATLLGKVKRETAKRELKSQLDKEIVDRSLTAFK